MIQALRAATLFDIRSDMSGEIHSPVLLEESMQLLLPENGGMFIDATLGLGGHSEAILEAAGNTSVIGIDRDPEALALAAKRLERFDERFEAVHANFSHILEVAARRVGKFNGVIADLGVSSLQFDDPSRGFSFRFDAPLDMRMDAGSADESAADILATRSELEIADIIYRFGEERLSRRIARRIIERRNSGQPISTTKQLAELVERSVGRKSKDSIHPATRTFQALRIAVNNELDVIEEFLRNAAEVLDTGGVLAVISFHSLEDRIVKQTFQRLAGKCICPPRIPQCVCGAAKLVEILTKKPITAGEREVAENPRSRSAKLRAVRKLAHKKPEKV